MRADRRAALSLLCAALLCSLAAQAQIPGAPQWYRSATGMLGRPAASVSARDIERMERYLYFGVPYCSSLAAAQYAANLTVARNMASYLASVNSTATDPDARIAAARVAAAFSSFPCAFPGKQLPVIALPPPKPGDPPFAMKAPDLGKISDADQETAADLLIRYDTDAPRAGSVWKNAETLRLSLAQKGMTLNAQTATSVGRLKLLFDEAAAALRDHNWEEALSNLQGAEATTDKIAATVGH